MTTGPEATPWALQLAARVEKLDPPTTEQVCIATAAATIALLTDERSAPDGEWHSAVSTWNGARIRKIVRRARGAVWARSHHVDGVTVEVGGAEVRAFVPMPIDQVPREVSKLQIQSSPLEPLVTVGELPRFAADSMVVAVTPHVEMSWGKAAAQCAHGAQLLWRQASEGRLASWNQADRPIVVVAATPPLWGQLTDTAEVAVHDAGYTEIPAGTNTTVAWWA